MTIDTNQFWNLISTSQLLGVQNVQTLFSEAAADDSLNKTPESLANWMVKKNAISSYQAKIILAGYSGPFRYGKYTVVDQIEDGLMKGNFAARHTKLGYPVLLQFLNGTEPSHLAYWNSIESLIETVSPIEHPHVCENFEAVVLPDHRFVVSEFPSGTLLADKLPRKGRLPWKKACWLFAQAASGLQRLHQTGVVHNAISPRNIWLNKSGRVQLRLNPFPDREFETPNKDGESQLDYRAPECFDNPTLASASSDVYALGCTMYRVIGGRSPFGDKDPAKQKSLHQNASPPDLSKYELPADLEALMKKMVAKGPEQRPKPSEIYNLLALHSGKSEELKSLTINPSKTREKYRRSLTEFVSAEKESVELTPEITTETPKVQTTPAPDLNLGESGDETSEDRTSKIEAAANAAKMRRKNRWKMPAAIAASLLALAGLIGGAAYMLNETTVAKNDNETQTDPESEKKTENKTDTEPDSPSTKTQPSNPGTVAKAPSVIQQLIEDDDQTLWETPTSGPPIEFTYLPLTPKLMFVIRPSELVQDPEGERIFKSLGPQFETRLEDLKNASGLEMESMEQLIVSLHSNDAFEYEPYFVVRTNKPIEPERMVQLWNRPTLRTLENRQEIYESSNGQTAYYVLHEEDSKAADDAASSTDENKGAEASEEPINKPARAITRFAFGNKSTVEQVALSAGANVLSGSLRKMSAWTDRDRHVNILFLRNSLFNDEGQKLMGDQMNAFNRELRLLIPDDVRGGLVSLHIDSGNYFEIMLDKNFDLKSPDLKEMMVGEVRSRRDLLMQFITKIPPNPYWDQVRFRYASMLTDLTRNLRWNVENGEVVANCWLPPMAAHNLIAASELVISFASGAEASAVPTYSGPKTLEELLATKRDLDIANPPDLNVLMANLKTEIEDELGAIPFPFNIRLIGGDLEKEGITKNQRPGELVMNQKSLSEILTFVMTSANPSKDITGPSDPECKLIWVVADDPESPGQKAILITTRKAAEEKSYELPPAFRLN